jgi:hypothetical protein
MPSCSPPAKRGAEDRVDSGRGTELIEVAVGFLVLRSPLTLGLGLEDGAFGIRGSLDVEVTCRSRPASAHVARAGVTGRRCYRGPELTTGHIPALAWGDRPCR